MKKAKVIILTYNNNNNNNIILIFLHHHASMSNMQCQKKPNVTALALQELGDRMRAGEQWVFRQDRK